MMHKRGLVVGKFCPLHAGHELVIGQAARQAEEVVIVSWTKPEFEGCAPPQRERWLRTRFPAATVLVLDDECLAQLCIEQGLAVRALPGNDAPDEVHREFVAWLCTALLNRTVDAVFTSEDYGDGLAATLARCFGRPVRHVSVDRARALVPVSGTAVRADIDAHRHLLAPEVYGDFVRRACFLGGESSGKSTLAGRFAEAIGSTWVPEFGRAWWHHRNGEFVFDDMLYIGRTQVAEEQRLAGAARRWLSCDTSPLTTLFYSEAIFGRADPELAALAGRHYDAVFLCAPDFAFVQDGTRREPDFRLRQHAWYAAELERRGVPYTVLCGSVEQRLAAVLKGTATPSLLKTETS